MGGSPGKGARGKDRHRTGDEAGRYALSQASYVLRELTFALTLMAKADVSGSDRRSANVADGVKRVDELRLQQLD